MNQTILDPLPNVINRTIEKFAFGLPFRFFLERGLRRRWQELPSERSSRAFSRDLLKISDQELKDLWLKYQQGTEENSKWFHTRYQPMLQGSSVLELGPGLGVDGVFFIKSGAKVTFADIVEINLNLLQRILGLFSLQAEYYYIHDFRSYEFAAKFDSIFALGSLIHVPFWFAKEQIAALTPWLNKGGTFLFMSYPKARFIDVKAQNARHFGQLTDGKRTQWAEWYDAQKIQALFGPSYELIFERSFGKDESEFNWFELKKK